MTYVEMNYIVSKKKDTIVMPEKIRTLFGL